MLTNTFAALHSVLSELKLPVQVSILQVGQGKLALVNVMQFLGQPFASSLSGVGQSGLSVGRKF